MRTMFYSFWHYNATSWHSHEIENALWNWKIGGRLSKGVIGLAPTSNGPQATLRLSKKISSKSIHNFLGLTVCKCACVCATQCYYQCFFARLFVCVCVCVHAGWQMTCWVSGVKWCSATPSLTAVNNLYILLIYQGFALLADSGRPILTILH